MNRILLFAGLLFQSIGHFAFPSAEIAPFHLKNGFVIIEGELNGKAGLYILDSGAPGLVLNSRHHVADNPAIMPMTGVGGALYARTCSVHVFRWEGFGFEAHNAPCIDLRYLEEVTGESLDGLVGLDLFGENAVVIDYSKRQIRTAVLDPSLEFTGNYLTLPLQFDQHVPTVLVDYLGQTLVLGMDTGSKCNLLGRHVLSVFDTSDLELRGPVELVGTDRRIIDAQEVVITGLRASESQLGSLKCVVADLQHLGDRGIDGILGHAFFAGRQIYFDDKREFMHITFHEGATAQATGIPPN